MADYKTPGVYIEEQNSFPNSVAAVETAIPAFIGYTEKAVNGSKSLLNKPMRITSMSEYNQYFGAGYTALFALEKITDAKSAPDVAFVQGDSKYNLSPPTAFFRLHDSMRLFYQNGGGDCYVVAVGDYTDAIDKNELSGTGSKTSGLATLLKESEPTMVIIPDSMSLNADDCKDVQAAMLDHCGNQTKNRIAILDVYEGYKKRDDPSGDVIDNFRASVSNNSFGCAYYPWIESTVVQTSEVGLQNFDVASKKVLQSILEQELLPKGKVDLKQQKVLDYIKEISNPSLTKKDKEILEKVLINLSPIYEKLLLDIRNELNLMAPGAAMAGVMTMVDNNRGVWKAPANVSLNSVVRPAVNISHNEQEDLNAPSSGKSVNAIRSFVGEGTLVWGARTLDGNNQDWRYINVRRTMIMVEQSVKNATKAFVFEPNDANTWVGVKSMIESFLNGLWTQGALAGAKPEDAYRVRIGLGSTMTSNDILDGIMRVSLLLALVRPAEFIEITFQQKMQQS